MACGGQESELSEQIYGEALRFSCFRVFLKDLKVIAL